MASLKAGHISEGASEGNTLPCPHCKFPNPRPRVQILRESGGLLCRRCQRTFPLPKDLPPPPPKEEGLPG